MEILAREPERQRLAEIYNSKRPEFIVIYGRRRVGKTYLVRNFFLNKALLFHITGVSGQTTQQQLWNFAREYDDILGTAEPIIPPKNWQEALDLLRRALQRFSSQERIVLFFDELPWLAVRKSGFVAALSHLWNRYLEADSRIILIVCGSAASWMINNVINSRGGLYNRLTHKIALQPLKLPEVEVYLQGKGVRLNRKQIVEVYMALGGIPAYLDNIKPGRSSAQIITDVCFDARSPLSQEFDRLFRSMFSNSELHTRAMRVLLQHRVGMPTKAWFEAAKITSGSVQRRVKQELIESGFIAETPIPGARKKGSLIRLIDEYTIFTLTWNREMQDVRQAPSSPEYWRSLQSGHRFRSWSGYAFEGVCFVHTYQIAKALGIHGIHYLCYAWSLAPTNDQRSGAQIDLVIDRADSCINLCEIKFHDSEFIITKGYAQHMEQRRQTFIEATKTRKTVFITMITTFGVKKNQYYHQLVDNQITLDALFE